MTDKAKALGLPTDEEILICAKGDTVSENGAFFFQRGAKMMRSEASSRIKEVAIEFAEWMNNGSYTQVQNGVWRNYYNIDKTHDELWDEFEVYLKEREGK